MAVGHVGSSHALNFSWLVRLRWAAIAGQLVTIVAVDRGMRIPLPLAPLFAIVALELASNVACVVWSRRGGPESDRPIAAVMALDVLTLTGLLYFTGGPFNPFSFLYLVEIALAAVILRPRWTWALVALALVCSALLFVDHRWLELPPRPHEEHMLLHLEGMWVAFGLAAALIVWFLMRIVRALATREAELQAARAQKERLEALATLAGGAAHELATPLSTIAVVARELERNASLGADAVGDVHLIRTQVDRCRAILEQMAAQAGASPADGVEPVVIEELLRGASEGLDGSVVRLEVDGAREARVPRRALTQVIRGLVKNACDASPPGADVVVRATVEDELRVEVRDHGTGMPSDVLARAGEPFFSTKAPGRGLGLGLFLARSVAEQLGGALSLESKPGQGTTAVLSIPLAHAPAQAGAAATNRRIASR